MAKIKVKSDAAPIGSLEPVYRIWGWILLFWSLYRYFLHFPEWVDEFVFKPVVFVGPVLWYVFYKEKRKVDTVGLTTKNLFNSLYIGLAFGFIFALEGLAINVLKHGQLNINPIAAFKEYGLLPLLFISTATAFSEEILNRGFLFSRIYEQTKNLLYSVSIATSLFLLLHVPILVSSLRLQGSVLVMFFISNIFMGVINNLLFHNTKSVIAPILVHIFWNMSVAMYL